ncbi:MAG TPA: hypothetical protein VI300_25465, partial [Solirubrobacter sp.]
MLAVCASVVVMACSSAPAFADIVTVTPLLSGSGTVSSSAGNCVATNKANGAITGGCAAAIGISSLTPPAIFPAIISLTAAPQASPAGHWNFVRWDGNAPGCAGATTPTCTVVTFSGAFVAIAVFEDHTGPTLTQPGVTYSTSQDRTVTMNWGVNEPVSSFTCSVDSQAFTACPTNGIQTLTLPEGTHTFRARGTDLSGNLGPISATTTFRILDTSLVSGPTDFSSVKSPTFVYASLTGLTFECSLDGAAFAACGTKGGDNRASKTLSNLAEGSHTFQVRARDNTDFDRVAVKRTWTVDTVAPIAKLDSNSGPGAGALQAVNTETFNFDNNETGSTFECRLDSA